jgi:hypothetical protein
MARRETRPDVHRGDDDVRDEEHEAGAERDVLHAFRDGRGRRTGQSARRLHDRHHADEAEEQGGVEEQQFRPREPDLAGAQAFTQGRLAHRRRGRRLEPADEDEGDEPQRVEPGQEA